MNSRLRLLVVFAFGLAPALSASAAEVFQVTRETKSALPRGKEADGMIGDWVIRNDRVVAVIGNAIPRRDANQMVEGVQGAVLDFTTRENENDQLVIYYPMGYRPTGLSANRVEVRNARGNEAEVEFIRDATPEEPFVTRTIYTLRDREQQLRVRTIHENTSDREVRVATHDWLRLDNDIACSQPAHEGEVVLLENKWYRAAYGVASRDGRTRRAEKDLDQRDLRRIGTHVHFPAVNPEQEPQLTLAPGGRLELDRYLLVGRDAAAVQIAASRSVGRAPRSVQVRAIENGAGPIADAFIEVKRESEFVTSAVTDENGQAALALADGTYELVATQIGRPTIKRRLVIADGKPDAPTLEFGPRTELTIDIAEAGTGVRMPVKLEFRTKKEGPNPTLGSGKSPRGAGNLFLSARGQDTFPLPPGEYAVHISRGPEYEVVVKDLTIRAGEKQRLTATLKRELHTPHWITADLHNHSTGGGDSAVEFAGRVLNLAAAGIEFGPATEHNRISTFTPTIEALGLQRFIASAAGIELSGRPGPSAINHQIAFPLRIQEDKQGFGAPPTDADPLVQMSRLFEYDNRAPKLMQHNHPDIGWLYFDKDRDGEIDGGFGTRPITHVMEIREAMFTILAETDPARQGGGTGRVFHWLQMLNQGDRIFGTANSDAHGIAHENGGMFNYVYLERDDPASLDPMEVAENIRRGRVVISNGPFLEVRIGDAIPGGSMEARDGAVAVKIRVQQASWSRIDRIQILVNGRQVEAGRFSRETHPEAFAEGVVAFDRTVPLQLAEDAHVIVVAAGENADVSRLIGGRRAKTLPIAVSNPIFVDVDGGGFRANGDTLGRPLPTGRRGGP